MIKRAMKLVPLSFCLLILFISSGMPLIRPNGRRYSAPFRGGVSFRSVLRRGGNNDEMKTLQSLLEDQVVKFSVDAVCGYLADKGDHSARKWLQQFHSYHDVQTVGLVDFFDAMCHGKEFVGELRGQSDIMKVLHQPVPARTS